MKPKPRLSAIGLLAAALVVPAVGADEAATVVVTQPRPAQPRTIELPGTLEPYEDAMLYARVTGYVSRVHVDIGDRVKAGRPLVQLDLPEMKPALGRARADVVASEATLEAVEAQVSRDRITHERFADLQAREPLAITQQDVDMAAADLRVSEAAARSANAEISVERAKLEELQALMAYSVIRAPFDAVVTQRMVDPGALVVSGADGGQAVLEVVREDRLRLVLAVPESVVSLTRAGVAARITIDAVPGRVFEATVSRCAGTLSRDTRTMRAEIDMGHEGGLLRPGMYATVQLRLDSGSDKLSVPASVIRHDANGQAFVWTVSDGSAVKAPVEIVRDDGASAVIQTGLQPETAIVLLAPADLREGQAVEIVGTKEEDR